MRERTIKRVIPTSNINMGGGLITRQPLPAGVVSQIDPFLLLHHTGPKTFEPDNAGLPFAPHPHKGFETVTFIFDGAVEHKDSFGFQSIIEKGGVQWMTAGKGIVHSENLPKSMKKEGATVEYIQLWINLPSKFKQNKPHYQGIQKEAIPEIELKDDAGKIRLVSGEMDGRVGPANSLTGIGAYECYLNAGKDIELPVEPERDILFYILEGSVQIGNTRIDSHHLIQFGQTGDVLKFSTNEYSRILICTGYPIGEPVVASGPFVMNTQTEIMEAMRDYQMGKMGILIED